MSCVDFKIVNYKGLLNIGITKVEGFDDLDKKHTVNIEVRALGGQSDYSFSCEGYEILQNDYFVIHRVLLPMHVGNQPLGNNIFDDEFYFREGVKPVDGYALRKPDPNDTINSEQGLVGGYQCPRSTNQVL